jgi:DNA-binding response OmpR family regulator
MNAVNEVPPSVLLVEDEFLVSMFVEEALRDFGLPASVFNEGKPALVALTAQPFCAAILDVALPDMSGEKIVEAIRDRFPTMPILLTTGLNDKDLHSRFLGTNHLRVLSKPFDVEMLRTELKLLGVLKYQFLPPTGRAAELVPNCN